METTQPTQNVKDEQGNVSAQAEPKDDEKQERLIIAAGPILDLVSGFDQVDKREIFKIVLDITDRTAKKLEEIEQPAAEQAGYEVGLKLPLQEQPSIDQQTQERLKAFFKNLDPKTKLAIVTFSEIQSLDGLSFQARQKDVKLIDEIWDDRQTTCLEKYHAEPDDVIAVAVGAIDKEDIWLAGIWEAVRMVLQNC